MGDNAIHRPVAPTSYQRPPEPMSASHLTRMSPVRQGGNTALHRQGDPNALMPHDGGGSHASVGSAAVIANLTPAVGGSMSAINGLVSGMTKSSMGPKWANTFTGILVTGAGLSNMINSKCSPMTIVGSAMQIGGGLGISTAKNPKELVAAGGVAVVGTIINLLDNQH